MKKMKSTKETLERSTSLHEAILYHADYAMIATDEAGVITLFNPAAERMLGYSAIEVVGQKSAAIFHDPIEVELRAKLLSDELHVTIEPGFEVFVAKTRLGLSNQHEWTYVRKDGSYLKVMLAVTALYNSDKDIIGFLGIAFDVSAKYKAELELQSARRDLSIAIELSQLGIWSWNVTNNNLYWNDRMFFLYEQPLALRDHGLTYDHWRMRIHPDDVEKTETALHRAVQGLGDYHVIFRIILPEGRIRYIQGAAKIERDAHGQALSVTGMNLDVTTQYEYQHLLKLDKEKSDVANQAKSGFLANMSHEIRTPMNALIGLIQLLRRTELDAYQIDYVNKLQLSGEVLLGILNDILDFSKIESNKLILDPQPTNLDTLLHNLAPMLAVNIGDRALELVFNLASDLPECILVDGLRLQQILLNLSSNAIKFTPQGEVIVAVKLIEKKAKSVIIEFSIRDTGIGISLEQIDGIFESFTQAETSITRRFGGTGLGLAISKKLVRLMGGDLYVESTLHQGSHFYFQIQCKRVPRTKCINLLKKDKTLLLKCLLVDDNLTARTVIGETLRSFGWTVEVAEGGEDAIDKIIHCDAREPFDLVYLDYRMPSLDGWETSKRIRTLNLTSPLALVMMVSVYDSSVIAHYQQDMPSILDGILAKPATPSLLFDSAANIFLSTDASQKMNVNTQYSLKRLAGLRLLLVEDNVTNQVVAHDLLTIEGADVAVEGDPYAVLDRIQRAPMLFDAVLMDIQMPGMDGYTLTTKIRECYTSSQLPIIAMSANTSGEDRIKAFDVGMDEYVSKPFKLDDLVSILLQVTNQAQLKQSRFDASSALSRFGGNQKVYERALATFVIDIEKQLTQLPPILNYDDDSVPRILHTLKGLASTFGANDVALIAGEMHESMIKKNLTKNRWRVLLDTLKHAGEKAIMNARGILADALPEPVKVSLTHSNELYVMLIAYLDEHNMKALDVYNQLLRYSARDAVLDKAMDQLDFVAAAVRCRELLVQSKGSS